MAKTKQTPQPVQRMLPDIPFDENSLIEQGDQRLETNRKEKASQPDYAAQLAEIQAKMAELTKANETLQRTNMALMGQGNVQPQMPQFGPTDVNLDNLPDPVTDPKGYAAEIVNRGRAVIQTERQMDQWQQNQRADMQRRVDGIWEQFAAAYPQYAGNTDLIEAASTKAVSDAKTHGIDPTKYMFGATPQFFADTVKILEGWGIKGETEEAEDKPTEQPVMRTGGIQSGNEGGGKPVSQPDDPNAKMPSLAEELRGWKMETGFY